ncbi:amino-acid permease inda1 [Drechslerella dactyloides]|uniref:Amino-acid permease inda1 n=1 Tax=Drechslerella dactyloides TaxID=74499 RepID=A0AAD6IWE0_DREDA|nr:amino-acid permease inda1 [Drechslerella dactyloides]
MVQNSTVYITPTSAPRCSRSTFKRPLKPMAEEKNTAHVGVPTSSSSGDSIPLDSSAAHTEQLSFWTRMGCTPESFKPRSVADKHNQLNQTLKSRHMNMIAIGGSIGAGLFVGSGGALATGGPASLIIDYSIIGIMIFNVVYALGEMAIMYPISGGFYVYSGRFIDPSWGFAMGRKGRLVLRSETLTSRDSWCYFAQWAIILPFEIIVASECIKFWRDDLSPGIWYTMFLATILLVNVFGVLGYGEEEFWSSLLKLAAVVSFLFAGLIFVLGGGPENGQFNSYWGARLWKDPGAFRNGFQGFCSVFVTAAFSFAGTELVGLAAAESKTPLKSLPSAVKQVFWRITLFYILSLLFIGLLIPSNDKQLFGSGNFIDTTASPMVLVANRAGIPGYASFLNAVILVSVVSIGNSGVFGASRTLCALSEQGYAPKLFSYVDKAGRPLPATVLLISIGCLAYVGLTPRGVEIFDWLLALSGLSALFTWGSICYCHIRFRAAWKAQGRTLDEIPFKAAFGVVGSWIGLGIIVVVLIAQFYVALFPPALEGKLNSATGFFKAYLAFFVTLAFWAIGYFWKGGGLIKPLDVDLDAGLKEVDWEAHRAEQDRRRNAPTWKRILYMFG